jgi:FkbM family methyltransferase
MKFLDIIKDKFESFFYLMKEGYGFRDKIIILRYYLKGPLQFINYMRGRKNSRDLRGDVFIRNKYGLFFCGKNFSSVVGASSICEPEVRKEFNVKEGDIVIDAGANCGMFTVQLAKIVGNKGRVISIEPEKNNIRLLKKNIELNRLKNVDVIEKGCYSKNGEMTFYIADLGTGGHSLLEGNVKRKEIIPVETIDSIIARLKISNVRLIKIDVEGVELEAFKGAVKILKKFHPKIIFEALDERKRKEIGDFLCQYGYKIRRIGEWNYVTESGG